MSVERTRQTVEELVRAGVFTPEQGERQIASARAWEASRQVQARRAAGQVIPVVNTMKFRVASTPAEVAQWKREAA